MHRFRVNLKLESSLKKCEFSYFCRRSFSPRRRIKCAGFSNDSNAKYPSYHISFKGRKVLSFPEAKRETNDQSSVCIVRHANVGA